jgi:hypothetical protein
MVGYRNPHGEYSGAVVVIGHLNKDV